MVYLQYFHLNIAYDVVLRRNSESKSSAGTVQRQRTINRDVATHSPVRHACVPTVRLIVGQIKTFVFNLMCCP